MSESDADALQRFRSCLRINKHRLDDDLEVHAEYQEQIAVYVNEAATALALEKDELAKVEARLTEDFREAEKSTKDTVEAKVRRNPQRGKAWDRYQAAISAHASWDSLLEAWKVKGKSLEALGRLFGAQYFALTSIGGGRDGRSAGERYERPNTRQRAKAD